MKYIVINVVDRALMVLATYSNLEDAKTELETDFNVYLEDHGIEPLSAEETKYLNDEYEIAKDKMSAWSNVDDTNADWWIVEINAD